MGREVTVSVPDHEGADQGALAELFRSRWAELVRLATFLTGSLPVAEDLVQDTFVRVGARPIGPDDPERYLRTSVVNACRSYHRRRFLERRHPGEPVPPGTDHPSELWDVLERLSARQRTAVVLRYYLDLSEGDIASTLRCRPSTVRSLIRRGLTKLREELAP